MGRVAQRAWRALDSSSARCFLACLLGQASMYGSPKMCARGLVCVQPHVAYYIAYLLFTLLPVLLLLAPSGGCVSDSHACMARLLQVPAAALIGCCGALRHAQHWVLFRLGFGVVWGIRWLRLPRLMIFSGVGSLPLQGCVKAAPRQRDSVRKVYSW